MPDSQDVSAEAVWARGLAERQEDERRFNGIMAYLGYRLVVLPFVALFALFLAAMLAGHH